MAFTFGRSGSLLKPHEFELGADFAKDLRFRVDPNYITLLSPHGAGRKFIPLTCERKIVIVHPDKTTTKIDAQDFVSFSGKQTLPKQRDYALADLVVDLTPRVDIHRECVSKPGDRSVPTKHKIRGEEGIMKVLSGKYIWAKGDQTDNQFTCDIDMRCTEHGKARVKIQAYGGTDVVSLNVAYGTIRKITKTAVTEKALLTWELGLSGDAYSVRTTGVEHFAFTDVYKSLSELLSDWNF